MTLDLDADGYPTEDSLRQITEAPAMKRADVEALLGHVRQIWQYAECGYWSQEGDLYKLSTGGWSGNEDIIGALQANFPFWALHWLSSRRGGHHEFELRKA